MRDKPQIGTGLSNKGTLIGYYFGSPFSNDVYSVTLVNLRMMLVTYYGTQNTQILRSLIIFYLLSVAQKLLSLSSLPTD